MDLRLSVLEFFRGLAHRIRLGSSKTRSNRLVSKLEFESHPPPHDRKAEEKVYGKETGWMDGSIRIVSRVEDASDWRREGGRLEASAVRSIYNWITAVVIRGEC